MSNVVPINGRHPGQHSSPLDADRVQCVACGEPYALADAAYESVGVGERGYTCPRCGDTIVLYSSSWLGERRG